MNVIEWANIMTQTHVYIIELERAIGNEKHQARYYVGTTTKGVETRLATHRAGKGAAMLRACNERGIAYNVVYVEEGAGREREREIKNMKNTKRFLKRVGAIQ